MGWMLFLILWLVYPVVGTIAIVVLCIMNDKYKKRIQELLEEKRVWEAYGRQGSKTSDTESEGFCQVETGARTEIAKVQKTAFPVRKTGASNPLPQRPVLPKRKKIQVHPGFASLIIGVIFVVIAGLIFATTNWNLIPDMCKVVMVLGLSVLFFIASRVAEKRLKIGRTGRAFYILGSVFLFLTVLAIGYFRVLGPGFVLEGSGRWWVLWAGSVATETAFLLGFRKYKERVFTWVYLGGLTVSVTFLMAALMGDGIRFAEGMLCYGFVLLLIGRLDDRSVSKKGAGFLPENTSAVWNAFSTVNFALFAGLMIPLVLHGFCFVYAGDWLADGRITLWNIFCTGLMPAGMAILAFRQKDRTGYKVLYGVLLAVFFQYAAIGVPEAIGALTAMEYRYLLAAALNGAWFVFSRRKRNVLWAESGDVIHTAAAAGNTAFLMTAAIWWTTRLSTQITASVAILILAGMAILWSRKYPVMRRAALYLLGLLTVTGYGAFIWAGMTEVRYNYLLFGYLVIAAIWDIVKKDCFWRDILLIGAVPQVVSLFLAVKPAPFLLFLSCYLFIKTRGQEGKQERLLFKGSCVCSLAGIYMELYWRLPNRVLAMFAVSALWMAECLVAAKKTEQRKPDGFWNMIGSAVFVVLMVTFYQNGGTGSGIGYGYLAVCLGLFYLIYGKLYLENSTFTHLPMVLVMLPLPWYVAMAYDAADGQILGGTAALVLLSGILFRLHGPVHVADEDGTHTLRIDWYHILVGPILIILAGAGGRRWESIYTLLQVLYVLQFAMEASLRKASVTLAMALGIWFWWRQPFIGIPELIWLETSLLPVAAAAAVLPKIWGDGRGVRGLRTGIHASCLAVLTIAALFTGKVWDALILEFICLAAFLAASKTENRFWKNLSGVILVLVVLYMTKGFWLSLSWWVYLLAAGIGLIAFAAWNEMNKKE